MKPSSALLLIPHYFHPEVGDLYGSTSADQRANRRHYLEQVLIGWRSLLGPYRELDWNRGVFHVHSSRLAKLDIRVFVYEDRHLLDDSLLAHFGASRRTVSGHNPRMLPFAAHEEIRQNLGDYDWFIYSEDDLLPRDPYILQKQLLFQRHFGSSRLLQPNRFEASCGGTNGKTYVDGDLPPDLVASIWRHVPESKPKLAFSTDYGEMTFERARNPHSGFFMLTNSQAQQWVTQSHFLDLDCSFVTPLESAGCLGLLKTFSLYKSSGDAAPFFEIEHLDKKFSTLCWPEHPAGAHITKLGPAS